MIKKLKMYALGALGEYPVITGLLYLLVPNYIGGWTFELQTLVIVPVMSGWMTFVIQPLLQRYAKDFIEGEKGNIIFISDEKLKELPPEKLVSILDDFYKLGISDKEFYNTWINIARDNSEVFSIHQLEIIIEILSVLERDTSEFEDFLSKKVALMDNVNMDNVNIKSAIMQNHNIEMVELHHDIEYNVEVVGNHSNLKDS